MTKAMTPSTTKAPKKHSVKIKKHYRRITPSKAMLRSREYWLFKENFNVAVVTAGAAFKDSCLQLDVLASKIVQLALYIEADMKKVLDLKRQEFKLP